MSAKDKTEQTSLDDGIKTPIEETPMPQEESPAADGGEPAEETEQVVCERLSVTQRISEMRTDILAQDWTPDKAYSVKGNLVRYVSIDKIKKTLAPLFPKHGLEFSIAFEPPIIQPSNKISEQGLPTSDKDVVIGAEIEIVSVDDPSDRRFYSSYGGARATIDKAIGIAQSYVLRYWMINTFLIVDGIDPEVRSDNGSGFHRLDRDEQEQVTSKVIGQGIAPKAQANPAPSGPFVLSGPSKRAVDRIVSVYDERAKAGEVSPEEYNRMSMAKASIAKMEDAVAFIREFKVGQTDA